jgi:hypothetical protein
MIKSGINSSGNRAQVALKSHKKKRLSFVAIVVDDDIKLSSTVFSYWYPTSQSDRIGAISRDAYLNLTRIKSHCNRKCTKNLVE